jgi:hypothetical protein
MEKELDDRRGMMTEMLAEISALEEERRRLADELSRLRAGLSEAVRELDARPRTTEPVGMGGPATPAPVEDPETGWRGVYEEFLRLRATNGEPTEGFIWERFRDKLRENRDLLVQRYVCRTVHFQVHDKEGRAALRATLVR